MRPAGVEVLLELIWSKEQFKCTCACNLATSKEASNTSLAQQSSLHSATHVVLGGYHRDGLTRDVHSMRCAAGQDIREVGCDQILGAMRDVQENM